MFVWPPNKQLLTLAIIGAVVVLVAASLTFWLLSYKQEGVVPPPPPPIEPKVVALQPMPEAWDKVMQQIHPKTDAQETPTDVAIEETLPKPKYITNAEKTPLTPKNAIRVAIVIDDVGVNAQQSQKAAEVLPPAVTFSFLPYGTSTAKLAQQARQQGREVMIHLPMEPMPRLAEPAINPGPNALLINLAPQEINDRTIKNLATLKDLAVGVNNHMGSRFTAFKEGMEQVLPIINNEGLFFLDSLTTGKTKVADAAKLTPDMPLLVRDVFLDHTPTEKALMDSLLALEEVARNKGSAIAIGHPHEITLKVLSDWIPTLPYKGIYLVPISHLLPNHEVAPFAPATPTAIVETVNESTNHDNTTYPTEPRL